MKKSTVLLVLAVLLITSVLAGCTGDKDPVATTTTTAATTTVDAVTTASLVDNADALVNALSANGTWIASTLNDITVDKDLIVEGEFKNDDVIARKIAPYTQDADRKVTASFTITAPKLIVRSQNTRFQNGTFVGDIYVEANGFNLVNAIVTGNLYFTKQEYKDSAKIDDKSTVSGETKVQ